MMKRKKSFCCFAYHYRSSARFRSWFSILIRKRQVSQIAVRILCLSSSFSLMFTAQSPLAETFEAFSALSSTVFDHTPALDTEIDLFTSSFDVRSLCFRVSLSFAVTCISSCCVSVSLQPRNTLLSYQKLRVLLFTLFRTHWTLTQGLHLLPHHRLLVHHHLSLLPCRQICLQVPWLPVCFSFCLVFVLVFFRFLCFYFPLSQSPPLCWQWILSLPKITRSRFSLPLHVFIS